MWREDMRKHKQNYVSIVNLVKKKRQLVNYLNYFKFMVKI